MRSLATALGVDIDVIQLICGPIDRADYGFPDELRDVVTNRLPDNVWSIAETLDQRFFPSPT